MPVSGQLNDHGGDNDLALHRSRPARRIIRDGLIKPATAGIDPGEKPLVWFSSNSVWEQTANKGIRSLSGGRRSLSFTEMVYMGGLCRIGVAAETAPLSWKQLRSTGAIRPATARALERVADRNGASRLEWYASPVPVASDKWLSIELYEAGRWVPFQPQQLGCGGERADQSAQNHAGGTELKRMPMG